MFSLYKVSFIIVSSVHLFLFLLNNVTVLFYDVDISIPH